MVSTCWGSSKGTHHLVLVLSKGTHNLPSSRWALEPRQLGNWTRDSPGSTSHSPLIPSSRVQPNPYWTKPGLALSQVRLVQWWEWGLKTVGTTRGTMRCHLRRNIRSTWKSRRTRTLSRPVALPTCSRDGKTLWDSRKSTRQPSNRSPNMGRKNPLVVFRKDRKSMYTHYGRVKPT